MNKSKSIFLIITILLISGCLESGVEGKYVSTGDPDDYLELNSDGTFFVHQNKDGGTYSGTYKINDDQIFLMVDPYGMVAEGRIEGKNLIDPEGGIWKKE